MMVRFVVLWCLLTMPISVVCSAPTCTCAINTAEVLSLECFHCNDKASRCKPGTNISKIIECTEVTSRCFGRTVEGETNEEDMIERGCINEEGCDIMIKACENSVDCKTTCCHQDRCNSAVGSGFTSNACTLACVLVIILILRWEVS